MPVSTGRAVAGALHRVDAPAHPRPRFDHLHARAAGFEAEGGGKPGEAGPDDHDVAPGPGRGGHGSAGPAEAGTAEARTP